MEYNTQREKIKINDYGRTIYKMVQTAKAIPSREERTLAAKEIVATMAKVNPSVTNNKDYEHTLWDHLMILADYQLDVDCPFPITEKTNLEFKPSKLSYKNKKLEYPYYGVNIVKMIRTVSKMEESVEKRYLTEQILQQMKSSYCQYNTDTVEDSTIIEHLSAISSGELQIEPGFSIAAPATPQNIPFRPIAKKKKHNKKK